MPAVSRIHLKIQVFENVSLTSLRRISKYGNFHYYYIIMQVKQTMIIVLWRKNATFSEYTKEIVMVNIHTPCAYPSTSREALATGHRTRDPHRRNNEQQGASEARLSTKP